MRRKRFILAASFAAAALTLALGTGLARADGSTLVRLDTCLANGGTATVPPGDVMFHIGYSAGTYGLISDVRAAQTSTLQVGSSTYDISTLWSEPINLGPGFWVIRQDVDLGPLASGQRVTVTFDIKFSHPVTILFPPVGSSGNNGPFTITEDGPYSCTITAS
jgi:hypothetical protein